MDELLIVLVTIYSFCQSNKFSDLTCGVCKLLLDFSVSKSIYHVSMFATTSKKNKNWTFWNQYQAMETLQLKPRSYMIQNTSFIAFSTRTPDQNIQKRTGIIHLIRTGFFQKEKTIFLTLWYAHVRPQTCSCF